MKAHCPPLPQDKISTNLDPRYMELVYVGRLSSVVNVVGFKICELFLFTFVAVLCRWLPSQSIGWWQPGRRGVWYMCGTLTSTCCYWTAPVWAEPRGGPLLDTKRHPCLASVVTRYADSVVDPSNLVTISTSCLCAAWRFL